MTGNSYYTTDKYISAKIFIHTQTMSDYYVQAMRCYEASLFPGTF